MQCFGVPVSGAMDLRAHRIANALVGNDTRAATLEVTLVGPELVFDDQMIIAVAGAAFDVRVDGHQIPMNASVWVRSGANLAFGARKHGARAYLAVRGGIDTPPLLGSRSTHLGTKMGGLQGRALARGDRLPIGQPEGSRLSEPASVSIPSPDRPARVRVLPGPHVDRFTADALQVLQSAEYTIGRASDRMGFRLEGPPLRHARGAEMISDATPLGVLQVPGSGAPVLLMADRPTTGGYPVVATVISADMPVAAQRAPGDSIRFSVCSQAEAISALIAEERMLMAIGDR
jgi:antagonist of KipI